MLGETAILDPDDIRSYPRDRLTIGIGASVAREATVDDYVISFRENQAMLVSQVLWRPADKVEQARAAWLDMCAMLDIAIRPKALRGP